MTIEARMYTYLSTHTDVKALVSTRIYPIVIPLEGRLPALAYQVLSDPPLETHQGVIDFHRIGVQFTAQADTYEDAVELSDTLNDAMEAWQGAVTGFFITRCVRRSVMDGYNLPGAAFTRRITFEIQFHERN
jgi:hypothetical protein